MPLDADQCPQDLAEVAVAYLRTELSEADTEAFENHLLFCQDCRMVVQRAEVYVRAMAAPAAEIRR